ncbi:MAG TPA: FAD-dependent oxidoreductase [Candidatus Lokiarchaeia archaeon]|nr:FAD-dependent oxidoreductase [Candidatus Lokiarchaeia archaeon]
MVEDSVFDVIIVGAGPGGLSCAMHAAGKGLKVLVLERADALGDKNASGCALSPKCWRDFQFMSRLFDEIPHRKARVATMHFIDDQRCETSSISYSPSKRFASYTQAKDFLAVNVYRKDLDTWLGSLATEQGATIKLASLVTSINPSSEKIAGFSSCKDVEVNESEHYLAPIVVGADGIFSQVCKSAGIKDRWRNEDLSLMVTIDYEADPASIEEMVGDGSLHYFYGANFPIGYVFFTNDGFHAGLGHYINWFIEEKVSPVLVLEEFLTTPTVQRLIKMTGGKPREFQAHCLPFLSTPRQLHADGFLILGDAAGLICPLEAEGVYYAMAAGRIAADVATEAKAADNYSATFLSRFEKMVKESPVGKEFTLGDTWKEFIDTVPFNLNASSWVNQLLPDALFSALNVSEAHSDTTGNLLHERAMHMARLIYPKVKKIAMKPLVSIFDEFLKHYLNKLNLSVLMKPLLESTRNIRERMIMQALDDWVGSKKKMEPESEVHPLSTRLLRESTIDVRSWIHVDPPARPVITHLSHRCIACGNCITICPACLWIKKDGGVTIEDDASSFCLECGGCFQACASNAILMQFPIRGGVKYSRG